MTPSEYINLLHTRQLHWIKVASFFGSKQPQDDVQDAYIRAFEYVTKNGIKEDVDPYGLMFFCVRSTALSVGDRVASAFEYNISDGTMEVEEDSEYRKSNDDAIVSIIHEEVESWEWFERTLFTLYFNLSRKNTEKMSMRKLAKETRIALPTIFNTIKECKLKIKNRINNEI